MKCSKCNMTMSENTRFCTHCGTVNPKFDTNQNTNNTSVCSACNTEVSNSSKFCGACGTLNPNYDWSLVNSNNNVNNINSNSQKNQTFSLKRVLGVIALVIGGHFLMMFIMYILVIGFCALIFSL